MLDVARKAWMSAPKQYKEGYEACRFLHVSTDEVYGELGETGLFTETTPYDPSSPYSASKAGSDHLANSYFRTYGLNIVITNCSNNYGPRQHSEKLIPVVINKAINGESIPVYGKGENVRDWLYVTDHCQDIDKVFHEGKCGESYYIGSRNEWKNIDIVRLICKKLDTLKPLETGKKYEDQITFTTDRHGHDWRYAIDPSKVESELGWNSPTNFEEGIQKTIEWYLDK